MTLEEIEAEISDSRLRHLLASACNCSQDNIKGLYHYDPYDFGVRPDEMEAALDLLTSKGYLQRTDYTPPTWSQKLPNMLVILEKGKQAGNVICESYDARQSKQATAFSWRWKDTETEAVRMLIWAWKQHKGDLNKTLDLRRYAREAKRSKYEADAAFNWLQHRRYLRQDDYSYAINAHCDRYWDVPINTFFPHEFRVALTPSGADRAASIIREDKAKWKKSITHIGSGIKEAPRFVAALAFLFLMLTGAGGYLLKAYQDRFKQSTPQVAAPMHSSKPVTRRDQ